MKFQINDNVEAIDDTFKGKVTRIDGRTIYIETPEGFEMTFDEKELMKVEPSVPITINYEDLKQSLTEEQQNRKRRIQSRPKDKKVPPMEVDLHIHQLTANSSRMTNHEMLTLQLETAQRQLEFAIQNRIKRVIFIHGVGEGVLKMELEYLFGRYANVEYYAAEYIKYGMGATEVYIYDKAK